MHKKERDTHGSDLEALAPFSQEGWLVGRGTTTGRAHLAAHRNRQDAVATGVDANGISLVVTDGCGSAEQSEFGAQWAAERTVAALAHLDTNASAPEVAKKIEHELSTSMRMLAESMTPRGASVEETLGRSFLFTLLIARVTRERTMVIGCGDGIYVVNAHAFEIDAGPANAPDYIAYRLVDDNRGTVRVWFDEPTDSVDTIAVATDGASPLLRVTPESFAPPTSADCGCVPPLIDVVHTVDLDRNPRLLEKRLRTIARRPHVLQDDTTIAMARRRSPNGGVPRSAS